MSEGTEIILIAISGIGVVTTGFFLAFKAMPRDLRRYILWLGSPPEDR